MPTTILSNPLPMAAMLEQTLSRSAATARSEEIRHSTPMKLHGVQSLRSDRPSLPKQVRTPGGSSSRSARQVARRRIPGVCRNSDSRSQSTPHGPDRAASKIGRASCRARVGQYEEILVVAESLKKTKLSNKQIYMIDK